MLHSADSAAKGDPDGDLQWCGTFGSITHLGHVTDDLLKCWIRECVELHLYDRADSTQSHADSGAGNPGLSQGSVETPVFAELLAQAFGDGKTPPRVPTSSPKTTTMSS